MRSISSLLQRGPFLSRGSVVVCCPSCKRAFFGYQFLPPIFAAMVDETLLAAVARLIGDTPDCGNGTGSKTWDERFFFG
jgi:hypothetical protein